MLTLQATAYALRCAVIACLRLAAKLNEEDEVMAPWGARGAAPEGLECVTLQCTGSPRADALGDGRHFGNVADSCDLCSPAFLGDTQTPTSRKQNSGTPYPYAAEAEPSSGLAG